TLFGPVLSERYWRPLAGPPSFAAKTSWRTLRLLFAAPRAIHEVIFGLILVNLLGLNPLVAVLAIGIPFGAVTAKVFSELIDEVPDGPERAFRAAGGRRSAALLFGVLPTASADLLSYGFYRLECSIRSAAVLGIVGAGGLGFQLALSFQSLRYEEMWTLLWALIILSGLADRWSWAVRRRRVSGTSDVGALEGMTHNPRRDPFLTGSAAFLTLLLPLSWWYLDLSISSLWSGRTRRLGGELARDLWPPEIGPGGWSLLLSDVGDTLALAVLAVAIGGTIASVLAFVAARSHDKRSTPAALARRFLGGISRFVLLVARAVPPPVWALLAVFVFLPGLWPGAIALAIYQLGVLGRLQGEVVENLDDKPGNALRAAGAPPVSVLAYATVPAVSTRFVALGLYRWEVAIRDTVMVGVVGAAGLGRRISEQTSAFNYNGILAAVLALAVITVAVDLTSAAVRRSLR
ncbi:MAG: ABC transporter permease subunit, partial [Acidimicrobiales bacterium]